MDEYVMWVHQNSTSLAMHGRRFILEVQFELGDVVVMVLVQFGEGLSHTKSSESSGRALEPALFHNFRNCRQDLDRKKNIQKEQIIICFAISDGHMFLSVCKCMNKSIQYKLLKQTQRSDPDFNFNSKSTNFSHKTTGFCENCVDVSCQL